MTTKTFFLKNSFEIINIVGQKLVKNFTKLLTKGDLEKKIVASVKDEGYIMTTSPQNCCKLWDIGFGGKFVKNLYWPCIF